MDHTGMHVDHTGMRTRSGNIRCTPPRMARRSGPWLAAARGLMCAWVLAFLTLPGSVLAAAGQWQGGGRLGVAWFDGSQWGPSLDAYLRRGLGESFDLDLQVLASLHPFQPDSNARTTSDTAWALGVVPGVLYRWDVLRVVPYAGAGLGVYSWHGVERKLQGTRIGASLRLGLDYLLSRSVVLSVQASAHLVSAESTVHVPWLQIGLGAGHAWGW